MVDRLENVAGHLAFYLFVFTICGYTG